jgi:hypothetical protein
MSAPQQRQLGADHLDHLDDDQGDDLDILNHTSGGNSQIFDAEVWPPDTGRKKSANFGREDGASRPVRRHTWALARTADGLDTRSFLR